MFLLLLKYFHSIENLDFRIHPHFDPTFSFFTFFTSRAQFHWLIVIHTLRFALENLLSLPITEDHHSQALTIENKVQLFRRFSTRSLFGCVSNERKEVNEN